jgi:diguanylate cyclase (GGDEF)-like protein/PAS domain S-box-containing protein
MMTSSTILRQLHREDRPARILIIDDDEDILASLSDLFSIEEQEYVVRTANSTFGAIITAKEFLPDIALIDIKLGSGNGLNLIPILKNNLPGISCVVMTAYRNTDYAVQALRSGADDYLHKPIDPEDLLEKVGDLINKQLAERTAIEQTQRFREIFEQTFQFLLIVDADGMVLDANQAALNFFGARKQDIEGQLFHDANWWNLHSNTNDYLRELFHEATNGKLVREEIDVRHDDGKVSSIEFTLKPVFGQDSRVSLVLFEGRDITNFKLAEKRLQQLAHYDPLTRLPNRALFNDRLSIALSHAHRHQRCAAVMFVDLDNFKPVNDNYGHHVGDELLVTIANRLRDCVREEDTVSRLSGDEFAIILTELAQQELAKDVAKRIVDSTRQPITINNQTLSVSASVGIALFPQDGEDAGTLLTNADVAMYRVKQTGKNNFHFFDASETLPLKV